jgi:hypothetical protein
MAGSQRLTYTDCLNQYLRNTGVKSTDPNYANIVLDFNQSLSYRYQMVLAKMANYRTQKVFTDTTVANTQYYSYPPGVVNFETVTVAVGSITYPVTVINSQFTWDSLNAIPFQPTTFPRFVFPRVDDYGIWPIPQGAYPITFNYHWRDRSLSVADYSTGTIAVTNGSAIIVGSGTTFTKAMVGRWFSITDPTEPGQGYWYRVLTFTDTTHLTLYSSYQGSTGSGYTYVIGESPEIPEEGHMALVQGVTADFYSNLKNDEATSSRWENRFWTGDPSNGSRKFGDSSVLGGLIGMINQYEDRNESHLVQRKPKLGPLTEKAFAITLSGS